MFSSLGSMIGAFGSSQLERLVEGSAAGPSTPPPKSVAVTNMQMPQPLMRLLKAEPFDFISVAPDIVGQSAHAMHMARQEQEQLHTQMTAEAHALSAFAPLPGMDCPTGYGPDFGIGISSLSSQTQSQLDPAMDAGAGGGFEEEEEKFSSTVSFGDFSSQGFGLNSVKITAMLPGTSSEKQASAAHYYLQQQQQPSGMSIEDDFSVSHQSEFGGAAVGSLLSAPVPSTAYIPTAGPLHTPSHHGEYDHSPNPTIGERDGDPFRTSVHNGCDNFIGQHSNQTGLEATVSSFAPLPGIEGAGQTLNAKGVQMQQWVNPNASQSQIQPTEYKDDGYGLSSPFANLHQHQQQSPGAQLQSQQQPMMPPQSYNLGNSFSSDFDLGVSSQPQTQAQAQQPLYRARTASNEPLSSLSTATATASAFGGNKEEGGGVGGFLRKSLGKFFYPDAHDTSENMGGGLDAYYDKSSGKWVFPGQEETSNTTPPPPLTMGGMGIGMRGSEPGEGVSGSMSGNSDRDDPLTDLMAPPSRSLDPLMSLMAPPPSRMPLKTGLVTGYDRGAHAPVMLVGSSLSGSVTTTNAASTATGTSTGTPPSATPKVWCPLPQALSEISAAELPPMPIIASASTSPPAPEHNGIETTVQKGIVAQEELTKPQQSQFDQFAYQEQLMRNQRHQQQQAYDNFDF